MIPLDVSLNHLFLILLMSIRFAAFFAAMPIFSDIRLPIVINTVLPLALALLLAPLSPVVVPQILGANIVSLFLGILNEVLVGVMMGFSLRLLFLLANFAGELIGMQAGFSMASMFDPSLGHSPLIALFMQSFLVLFFFETNGHHQLIAALAGSYQSFPPGVPNISVITILGAYTKLFSSICLLAIRFSLPVIATILMAHVVTGIISVAAPQMNFYFNVALSMNVVVALLIVTFSFGSLFGFFQTGSDELRHLLINVFLRH